MTLLRRRKKRALNADHVAAALGLSAALGIATIVTRLIQNRVAARAASEDFVLRPDHPLDKEIRRTASYEIATAMRALAHDHPVVREATVHDSRKRMRKLRSLVRLSRDQLGAETFARDDQAVRAVAKRMSPARDAHVLVETLDMLVERFETEIPQGAFDGLRRALKDEARRQDELLSAQVHGPEGLVAELETLLRRVAEWELRRDGGPKALRRGARRIYARGRRAHRAARKDRRDTEALHRLRRRTKDLRHALELAGRDKPASEAKKLTSLLGEEHDLAVLQETARRHLVVLHPGHEHLLADLIERERKRLQREALALARRIYAKKPGKAKLI